jgi:arylsulfatase A-like enzyme
LNDWSAALHRPTQLQRRKENMMNSTRREFLRLAGLAAAGPLLARRLWAAGAATPAEAAKAGGAPTARKPNILFFFPDQHRYDWTSMNPALPDMTPNLKKLAARGVHFANALCPSPVCAPSRACLASGKEYPNCGVGGNGNNYPVDQTTFYCLLKAAGYHTLGCGKFDLAKPSHSWGADGKQKVASGPSRLAQWGFTDGIDNAGKMDGWTGYRSGLDEPYFAYLKGKGLVDAYARNYKLLDHDYDGPAVLPDEAYGDNWIARNGLELIAAVPKGTPWFIQVNFNGPHNPMDITKSMYERWKDAKLPAPVEGDGSDNTAKQRRNYAAMIYNIDHWLGVYIDEIAKRGELDNTIIAFCSDHGEMLGDHGQWGKTKPRHASAAVPLVVAGPGVAGGRTCTDAVETLDLVATFLDFAGLTRPADMDSLSLRPYLAGEGKLPRQIARSALGGWTLVFDGRYKLISGNAGKAGKKGRKADKKDADADEEKGLVLYDLKTDPGECTDLAGKNPDVVARLKPLLSPVEAPAGRR